MRSSVTAPVVLAPARSAQATTGERALARPGRDRGAHVQDVIRWVSWAGLVLPVLAMAACAAQPECGSAQACVVQARETTSQAHGASAVGRACDSLDACIAQLREVDVRRNPSNADTALVARIRTFDGAVPRLVALLADPNEQVADLAAYGLRDAESIDAAFLPQIVAGLDRGLGWLPPALAHMPGEAPAREAVARYLVSDSAPHNQEAYALELMGVRAVPYIVNAARCQPRCGEQDHYNLGAVLAEMEEDARTLAAPQLMAVAEEPAASEQAVRGTLEMIGQLGTAGASLEPRLQALRGRKPELAASIDETLVGIGSSKAGDIFSQRLRESPDIYQLRDLADTGSAGVAAGPVLVELLRHPDWEIRQGAARALGFIGYADGASALVPLLDEPTDVRLNWIAAESLGRLQAASALPALQRAAQSHWFPAVRQAASRALVAIAGGKPYADESGQSLLPEFFAFMAMAYDLPTCIEPELAQVAEPPGQKLAGKKDADRLAKLAYAATIVSFGAADETEQKAAHPDGIIQVTPRNIVEHRQIVPQTPSIALRVDDGWLVGSDRGEFGGELAYVDDKGVSQTFLDENVEDIYRLGPRLVAVTGLAHMGIDHGLLYELARGADGRWTAKPWRTLPSAPGSSWFVPSGELQVNSYHGVSVLIDPAGAMRMAPCRKYERKQAR
jgi:HEAT repeat protein